MMLVLVQIGVEDSRQANEHYRLPQYKHSAYTDNVLMEAIQWLRETGLVIDLENLESRSDRATPDAIIDVKAGKARARFAVEQKLPRALSQRAAPARHASKDTYPDRRTAARRPLRLGDARALADRGRLVVGRRARELRPPSAGPRASTTPDVHRPEDAADRSTSGFRKPHDHPRAHPLRRRRGSKMAPQPAWPIRRGRRSLEHPRSSGSYTISLSSRSQSVVDGCHGARHCSTGFSPSTAGREGRSGTCTASTRRPR